VRIRQVFETAAQDGRNGPAGSCTIVMQIEEFAVLLQICRRLPICLGSGE
jgi:hypothetical protein